MFDVLFDCTPRSNKGDLLKCEPNAKTRAVAAENMTWPGRFQASENLVFFCDIPNFSWWWFMGLLVLFKHILVIAVSSCLYVRINCKHRICISILHDHLATLARIIPGIGRWWNSSVRKHDRCPFSVSCLPNHRWSRFAKIAWVNLQTPSGCWKLPLLEICHLKPAGERWYDALMGFVAFVYQGTTNQRTAEDLQKWTGLTLVVGISAEVSLLPNGGFRTCRSNFPTSHVEGCNELYKWSSTIPNCIWPKPECWTRLRLSAQVTSPGSTKPPLKWHDICPWCGLGYSGMGQGQCVCNVSYRGTLPGLSGEGQRDCTVGWELSEVVSVICTKLYQVVPSCTKLYLWCVLVGFPGFPACVATHL